MTAPLFCSACGTANSADSRFCGRCGAQIHAAPQAAPQAAQPVPPQPAPQAPPPAHVAVPQKPTPSPFAAAPPSGILSTGLEPADSKLRTMMMRASGFEGGESSSASHAVPPQAQQPLGGDKSKDPRVSTGGRVPQRTVMGISMGAPPSASSTS
ncbi:MAG: zinc ribbon domain-containing protein, partial [Deltaproteobacteria bacterium]|nr:zinc ribbon domain-containing protein [Deltaproteobacteria bacterium]